MYFYVKPKRFGWYSISRFGFNIASISLTSGVVRTLFWYQFPNFKSYALCFDISFANFKSNALCLDFILLILNRTHFVPIWPELLIICRYTYCNSIPSLMKINLPSTWQAWIFVIWFFVVELFCASQCVRLSLYLMRTINVSMGESLSDLSYISYFRK